MVELGQLEARHEDFARRNTRVVAASIEGRDQAMKTQKQFPHLVIVADADRKLISAVEVLHRGVGPGGEDAAVPEGDDHRVRKLVRRAAFFDRHRPA